MKETGKKSPKRKIVWICNILVAAVCLLSIVCYFFGPVWQIGLTYRLSAADFEKLIAGSNFDIDANEVIGPEGEEISASLSLTTGDLFGSFFSSADETVDRILDNNVDSIVDRLSGTINAIAKKTVKSVAKQKVKSEVNANIKKFLNSGKDESEHLSDEEVQQKLDELGFTDDYISEKTDKIIDGVFEGGSDIEQVTSNIMDTVDEVYDDFKKNAAGKEGYEEFTDVDLSDEDRAEIEGAVRDMLKDLAKEDGTIDPNELIAEMLTQALNGGGSSGGGNVSDDNKDDETSGKEEIKPEEKPSASQTTPDSQSGGATNERPETPKNSAFPVGLAAALDASDTDGNTGDAGGTSDTGDANAKLAATIKDKIVGFLPAEMHTYLIWALRGMAALMILSMLPWAYILIKLLVKLASGGNPTVKLALPIWLGWLFYFIFGAIPSIGIFIIYKTSLFNTIATAMNLGAETMEMIANVSISMSSIAWITAIAALIMFAISIFYMVMRRKIKREESAVATEPQSDEDDDVE